VFVRSGLALADEAEPAQNADRKDLVSAIKRLERKLGFRRTRNFRKTSKEVAAAYRCYYTGRLELPLSYEGLQLQTGTSAGCPLDTAKYDVFFYPLEAKASGRTPLTTSLGRESVERFLVVVPHEDFHADPEFKKLPATLSEASSTLIGFLAAIEVARQRFGSSSEVYQNLAREPELFLHKAEIVNRYYARLRRIYEGWQAGGISESSVLAQKKQVFEDLQGECKNQEPDPTSFNKCLAANNNAGLAFDATYTRYYPLVYDLYLTKGKELQPALDALRRALAAGAEAEAVRNLQALVKPLPATAAGLPATPPAPAPEDSPSCCSPSPHRP